MLRYSDADIKSTTDLTSAREGKVVTNHGRTFYVKTSRCRKCKCQDRTNPTWIANEVAYSVFANAAGLRIPNVCLIERNCTTCFGSEILADRSNIDRRNPEEIRRLARLAIQPDNLAQVVRATLLDIALLNSDRHANNFLLDRAGLIWFFDHDGCLWGDGYPPEMLGDLGRVFVGAIPEKTPECWIMDYLKCGSLNRSLWDSGNIQSTVHSELQSLPLDLRFLEEARRIMPRQWLSDSRMRATTEFLSCSSILASRSISRC